MPDGHTVEQFKGLPVGERAMMFAQYLDTYSHSRLVDPRDQELTDIIINRTYAFMTGGLKSPDDQETAIIDIATARVELFNNYDRNVGRVAEEAVWAAALYFNPEIKRHIELPL